MGQLSLPRSPKYDLDHPGINFLVCSVFASSGGAGQKNDNFRSCTIFCQKTTLYQKGTPFLLIGNAHGYVKAVSKSRSHITKNTFPIYCLNPKKLSSNSDEHKVNFVSIKVSTVHDPYIEEVFTGPPMKGQVLQPLGHFSS